MTQIAIPNADPVATLTFEDVVTVDISSFTGSGDYISLSLPEYQAAKLVQAKCFIDFTSNPNGDFGTGPTDNITFSQASPALPTTGTADAEMRIPISLLTKVNKAAISGVRIRLFSSETAVFRCLSIRACAQEWAYAPIDLDTLWHRIGSPPTPNGASTYVNAGLSPDTTLYPSATLFPQNYNFPEAEGRKWPILFRSNPLSGLSDPMPVNVKLGVAFVAGSFTQATGTNEGTFNQVAIYLRDVPTDDQTQVELNGNGIGTGGFNQSQLDVINHQPDFGRAMYKARFQEELDKEAQGQIDTTTQFQIERIPDESEHSWIEVKFKWCETQGKNTLTIKEADGNGYTFSNIPVVASSGGNLELGRYIMLIDLLDNRIRVKIYKTDQVGNILENELVFDTGNIVDDNLFKRYRGRVGWWAQFPDGDAFLTGFRTRGVNFGELISKEFQSITPVKGASLFAGSTEDKELVRYLATTDSVNTTALLDPSVSDSGRAYRVVTTPLRSLQGLATNMFAIDDPTNLDISFDINFPSSEIPGGGLSAYLIGAYFQIIPLQLPAFSKDTWAHVKVPPPTTLYQTGNYQLVLMQALPVVSTTWFVDNLSVKTEAVKWWARSHVPDAWQEKIDGWQQIGFTLNSLNGGVVFSEKGNGLQVKAQALHQEAEIHEFKIVPQYATLGRTVWPEGVSLGSAPSSVSIAKAQVEGRKWKFTGSATDTDGYPTFLWSLGDGTYDAGKVVTHTYKLPGTYKVILYATDNFGNTTTAIESVTVT